LGVGLVSLATPLVSETVREKWFDFPRTLWLMILPVATLACGTWLWRTTRHLAGTGKRDMLPYLQSVAIFSLAFLGLASRVYPYVVIDKLTMWDAAAHPSAQRVVFIGAVVVVPFIIGYTILAYRIFGGKARDKLYD